MNEVATVEQTAPILAMVERVAMNPEADMDKLERLLDMQERVLNRESEMAFNAAMSELQADMPTITKGGKIEVNGQVRSKYARFEDIANEVRPLLAKHGFSISFRSDFPEGQLEVTGIIAHKGGHREETTMRLPFDSSGSKNSVQAIGSSVSYGKRYVMCMLLNIATSEDDDGIGAAVSPEQTLNDLLANASKDLRKRFFEKSSVDSVEKIDKKRQAGAINWLRTELKKEQS